MKKADIKVGEQYAVLRYTSREGKRLPHLHAYRCKVEANEQPRRQRGNAWGHGSSNKKDGYLLTVLELPHAGDYHAWALDDSRIVTGGHIVGHWSKEWAEYRATIIAEHDTEATAREARKDLARAASNVLESRSLGAVKIAPHSTGFNVNLRRPEDVQLVISALTGEVVSVPDVLRDV